MSTNCKVFLYWELSLSFLLTLSLSHTHSFTIDARLSTRKKPCSKHCFTGFLSLLDICTHSLLYMHLSSAHILTYTCTALGCDVGLLHCERKGKHNLVYTSEEAVYTIQFCSWLRQNLCLKTKGSQYTKLLKQIQPITTSPWSFFWPPNSYLAEMVQT